MNTDAVEGRKTRDIFNLKEKQVLFNFKGFHAVLQLRLSKNHEAFCCLSR